VLCLVTTAQYSVAHGQQAGAPMLSIVDVVDDVSCYMCCLE